MGRGKDTYSDKSMLKRWHSELFSSSCVLDTGSSYTDRMRDGVMRFFLWLALLLPLLLAGCGSSGIEVSSLQGAPVEASRAEVPLNVVGPRFSANVEVLDASGEVLAQEQAPSGSCVIGLNPSASKPSAVRLRIEDPGQLGAGQGSATFLALTDDDSNAQTVGIDAVTTLIALYARAHPELSDQQAAQTVFAFLGLPPETEPDHLFARSDFDDNLFLAQAKEVGGVDLLEAKLLTELENGQTSSHNFLTSNLGNPFAELALDLAKSGASFGGGKVAGWLLAAVGKNGPNLAEQISAVNGRLTELSSSLADGYKKIQYTQHLKNFNEVLAPVQTISNTLALYTSSLNDSPPTHSQIQDLVKRIRSRTNFLADAQTVDKYDPTFPGMHQLFIGDTTAASVEDPTHPGEKVLYAPEFYPLFHARLNQALALQDLLLYQLVEAFHQSLDREPSLEPESPDLALIENYVDSVLRFRKEQRNLQPLPIGDPEKVLLDPRTGLLWVRTTIKVDAFPHLDQVVSETRIGGYKWRHASGDDIFGLLLSIGRRDIDQHQNLHLNAAGFLNNGNGKSFAEAPDLGSWSFSVFTSNLTKTGALYRTLSINLLNARTEEPYTQRVYLDGGFRIVDFPFQIMLCCEAPQITSLTVTQAPEDDFKVQLKAVAKLSDGQDLDVTKLVVWELTTRDGGQPGAAEVFRGHVSNLPESSGLVTLRGASTEPLHVMASYQGYNRPRVASAAVEIRHPSVPRKTGSLLVYPVSTSLVGPGTVKLRALRVFSDGLSEKAGDGVTWSVVNGSGTHATIDANGQLSYPFPVASKELIEVQAKDDASNKLGTGYVTITN